MPRSAMVYMSTSTLENAVDVLTSAGNCFERREDADETAARHGEHVFPIEVKEE